MIKSTPLPTPPSTALNLFECSCQGPTQLSHWSQWKGCCLRPIDFVQTSCSLTSKLYVTFSLLQNSASIFTWKSTLAQNQSSTQRRRHRVLLRKPDCCLCIFILLGMCNLLPLSTYNILSKLRIKTSRVSFKHKSGITHLTVALLDVSWRSLGSKSWDSLRPSSLQPLRNRMVLS